MISAMFAMFLLTTIVGLVAFKARYQSVVLRELSVKAFKLTQYDQLTPRVIQTSRCFNNQFEVPMLFYIACSLFLVTEQVSHLNLILAFLFVALRCVHAYIFITYNNVLHRMIAYWAAFFVLAAMWLILFLNQI